MFWQGEEISEVLRMIEHEHLDIRTVTMGISLRGTSRADLSATAIALKDLIQRRAERFVAITKQIETELGVPITNTRLAVTPIAFIAEASAAIDYAPLARAMDEAAESVGVDYIGGFSALVEKGMTEGDRRLIESIPEAIGATDRVCSSLNVATTRAGINIDAINLISRQILGLAQRTADRGGIGCAKLVVFCNIPEDNPFIAGAMHGMGEPDVSINVGVSGPGVVRAALHRLFSTEPRANLGQVAETIKRTAFKVTRAGQLIGQEVARRLGPPASFGIVDLSLAPTPAIGDSVAEILQVIGLEQPGAPGTTAALALITDAVKKGGLMASSAVGGLSGAFIPISEDHGMVEAVRLGALSLEKLEAMTAVCSVGLDMVAIPGDTPPETISAIIADEMAIGMINNKTTAVRLLPVPGKAPGESYDYGGLLGRAQVMAVNRFGCRTFVSRGGRIPAPLTSLRN
jgi:uncharacterized protein (UPF0210 family)